MKALGLGLLVIFVQSSIVSRFVAAAPPVVEPEWLPVEQLVVDTAHPSISQVTDDKARKVISKKRRCVCVRGIFPLKRQLAIFANSLPRDRAGIPEAVAKVLQRDKRNVAEDFSILDFVLERQSIAAGSDFEGDLAWQKVRLKTALDLLEVTEDFADEVIAAEQVNNVFTMPLPKRTDAGWGELATHPALRKAEGILLFRYLDFDVKPGNFYRYRVKLVVKNPNLAYLTSDPFVSRGMTRETPWSRPSQAVLVKVEQK